jgi:dCTP deaminase
MRLCDIHIKEHLEAGTISIDPAPKDDMISGVTVDLTLGNKFRVFQDHKAPYVDLSGPRISC